MKRRSFNKILGLTALSSAFSNQYINANPTWELEADIAESCGCNIPCPCNFGKPTEKKCYGNRLIQIRKGYIDDNDISGINFVVTFEMGKWSRIFIDDQNRKSKQDVFNKLLKAAFTGFYNQAEIIIHESLVINKTKEFLEFSTSESYVKMKPMLGINGKQIRIDGLPYNAFYNYIQYESIHHSHTGPNNKWNLNGTNGFTSLMLANG